MKLIQSSHGGFVSMVLCCCDDSTRHAWCVCAACRWTLFVVYVGKLPFFYLMSKVRLEWYLSLFVFIFGTAKWLNACGLPDLTLWLTYFC
jgi:hypothetical protein